MQRCYPWLAGLAAVLIAVLAAWAGAVAPAHSQELAKNLFGSKRLPATLPAASHGFYSKGCLAGGIAIASDGPTWQAMRLSRNRRWGHPTLIRLVERLSREAVADGWPGLLIGDISQPRGGPMTSGHASHQIGLDADIWFNPMPARRMTVAEREKVSAVSMIKANALTVDEKVWTPAHARLLRRAASYPEVERILVHPGIKKKLCETVTGDRAWLNKIRPFWGHDYHFHIRLGCQPGSPGCKGQASTGTGTGCDSSLAWWFTEEPWRPSKEPPAPKARDVMTMAALPKACRAVLAADSPASEAVVTWHGGGAGAALASASGLGVAAPQNDFPVNAFLPTAEIVVPLPQPRPAP